VIEVLQSRGDARGEAFDVPRAMLGKLGAASETHLVTMLPGSVRGNHQHPSSAEILVVFHRDRWLLAWRAPGGEAEQCEFTGVGAVAIYLEAGVAHALRNTGGAELVLTSLSNWTGEQHAPFERVMLIEA
jgi:mannose-6-phosphate isomerase-like protein (cupin superfamily)